MITLRLSARHLSRLRRELRRAGHNEIGGVLAAENLSDGLFEIADFSIQQTGGSIASFVREPAPHRRFMRRFFQRTEHQFERFNYIGEWHSHPLFPAYPSPTDLRQMQRIADDPQQAATFVVLLIVRLGVRGGIEASAHAFRRGVFPVAIELEAQEDRVAPLEIADTGLAKRAGLRRRIALKSDRSKLS